MYFPHRISRTVFRSLVSHPRFDGSRGRANGGVRADSYNSVVSAWTSSSDARTSATRESAIFSRGHWRQQLDLALQPIAVSSFGMARRGGDRHRLRVRRLLQCARSNYTCRRRLVDQNSQSRRRSRKVPEISDEKTYWRDEGRKKTDATSAVGRVEIAVVSSTVTAAARDVHLRAFKLVVGIPGLSSVSFSGLMDERCAWPWHYLWFSPRRN
jgi:hypothetical protein